jgi:hypothetical protein
MPMPEVVADLIARYRTNRDHYRQPEYKEHRLRVEFIDPLFTALGWDVQNTRGYSEAYKDGQQYCKAESRYRRRYSSVQHTIDMACRRNSAR